MTRLSLGLAVAVALGMTLAAPAHAQLGGLKKLKDKVQQSTSDKPADASTESTPATGKRSPYGKAVLEITPEVMGRFEAAMAAELAEQADFTKWAATAKSADEYQTCQVNTMMTDAGQKMTAEYVTVMEGKQGQAAVDAMGAYAKKLEVFMEQHCGPNQKTIDARRAEVTQSSAAKAQEAGSFNATQYAILKERIVPICSGDALAHASEDGLRLPGDGSNIYWVYSATEVDVLRAKCPELMKQLKQLL